MTDLTPERTEVRSRILDVTTELLREHGAGAVTTRGVADAAGVQAPTIYRLFGDKDGLLEAVAEHAMTHFVAAKAAAVELAAAEQVDALDELRSGWSSQIDFGLANPALFRLLSDPSRMLVSPTAQSGRGILERRVRRLAAAARLRVSERRAVDLIQVAGIGTVSVLLSVPSEDRDPGLADAAFEAVLQQILTDAPSVREAGPVPAAVALRAVVSDLGSLSEGEQRLLTEWLDRAITAE